MSILGNADDAKIIALASNKVIDCYSYIFEGTSFIDYTQELEFQAINDLEADQIMKRYVHLLYDSSKNPQYKKVN